MKRSSASSTESVPQMAVPVDSTNLDVEEILLLAEQGCIKYHSKHHVYNCACKQIAALCRGAIGKMSSETLQYPAKIAERPRDQKGKFSVAASERVALPEQPVKRHIEPVAAAVDWCVYPAPPKPMLPVNESCNMPETFGIYFVWRDERIVYVGQSRRLVRRCNSKYHSRIREDEWISWLTLPAHELYFAECFYVGALRPERNRQSGFIPPFMNGGQS